MISRSGVGALVSALVLSGGTIAEPGDLLEPARDGGVAIDLGTLSADEIAFDLPGAGRVVGFITQRLDHDNGNSSWIGIVPERDDGWFTIAAAQGVAHAYIDAGELGVFELKHRGDGTHEAVRVDLIEFEPCAGPVSPVQNERGIPGALERAMIEDHTANNNGNTGGNTSGSRGSVNTIDVMVVYTAEARIGEGGTGGIQALAQNSINVSNIAYANSDIQNLELRLVHTEEVDYAETDNPGTDLSRLRSQVDGFMDGVHATRDAVGADLVALLVDDLGPACGVAYLAPFSASSGFSVTDADCAVGNLSFPHEIGHNQGATHDVDNAGGAVYSFGYGWRWFGTNGNRYRSVMAYSPGSRVRQFSNPDVSFQGTPTGTADADNAQVLELTAESVAAFRTIDVPLTFTFPNGLPADLTENQPTTVVVDIDPGTEGPIDPASALLFYGYDVAGQPFQFVPLANTGGTTWQADLPGGDCGQTASFYVSINNTGADTFTTPSDPSQPYTAAVTDCLPDCLADTNGDGIASPADFNAWILAFNSQAPECDQNGDGLCSPSDFNAWILNYNAGC
jgi:hypothetical protein